MTGVADKCLTIAVPEGAVADDAYVAVNAAFDAEGASVVLAEPAARILSLVGRLAAHLGTAAITDVQSIEDGVATSMYFGGAGVRQAKAAGDKAVYTVAAGTFDASGATGTDAVEELAWQAPAVALTKIGSEELPPSGVNLQGADVVIGCGRGFAQQDDLQMARDLAAKTGAELACTRPLTEGVDWFPREAYLGVSGQIIAPEGLLRARSVRPDAAHGGRHQGRHHRRRQQGQERPGVQAVRPGLRRRSEDRHPRAGRGSVSQAIVPAG